MVWMIQAGSTCPSDHNCKAIYQQVEHTLIIHTTKSRDYMRMMNGCLCCIFFSVTFLVSLWSYVTCIFASLIVTDTCTLPALSAVAHPSPTHALHCHGHTPSKNVTDCHKYSNTCKLPALLARAYPLPSCPLRCKWAHSLQTHQASGGR
jgi:hypothetical protein